LPPAFMIRSPSTPLRRLVPLGSYVGVPAL
jgi:hypothetical protein